MAWGSLQFGKHPTPRNVPFTGRNYYKKAQFFANTYSCSVQTTYYILAKTHTKHFESKYMQEEQL